MKIYYASLYNSYEELSKFEIVGFLRTNILSKNQCFEENLMVRKVGINLYEEILTKKRYLKRNNGINVITSFEYDLSEKFTLEAIRKYCKKHQDVDEWNQKLEKFENDAKKQKEDYKVKLKNARNNHEIGFIARKEQLKKLEEYIETEVKGNTLIKK